MKRFITTVLVGLSLQGSLQAKPQANYSNYGQVNAPINIDAVVFENFGNFDVNNSFSFTNSGSSLGSGVVATFTPFVTQDTLYFTNTGTMLGAPGFQFDTGTSGSRHSAISFNNSGIITGVDTPAGISLILDTSGHSINYPLSQPEPSDILVFATNILNNNSMSVGKIGLLQMTGSNINVANGSLAAGFLSDSDPNDLSGREDIGVSTKTAAYFADPPEVYDLFWGTTNGDTLDLSSFVFSDFFTPGTYDVNILPPALTTRGVGGAFFFGFGEGMTAYAYETQTAPTNIYYNVVFLDTNFTDTNITANVGFGPATVQPAFPAVKTDGNANGDIIQFSETVTDVITGQIVTNSIYLLDSGALVSGMSVSVNAAYVNGYGRPNCFEISTTLPFEWLDAQPTNMTFDPTLIFNPGDFANQKVSLNDGMYGAQIGRNPEAVDGTFQPATNNLGFNGTNLVGTNFGFFNFIDIITAADLPDITNEPGRVEIFGNQVNLSNTRLRAEGVVSLTASNLIGTPLAKDWGNINGDLNVTGGFMTVSNIFPTNFQRLRGDISAWSADWVNTQTNVGATAVTNTIHYHVLWVEPNLRANFASSIRNLTLRATNTVVQDNLRVINQALFLATNLTFNSGVILTQNAPSFLPATAPKLKNFWINTNGVLTVDNIIDIGFDTTKGHTAPTKRKYTIASITNFGTMTAIAPLLQSSNFESDGIIIASNGGSMVIEAASLGLGLDLTNATNYLLADGDITLSANSIQITNSQIITGGADASGRGLLLLESTPNGQITDFASGTAGTNTYITNMWQVTDGFSLPVKPLTGDLFGTQITTIATNFTVALHTWAGVDLGASSAGFADNMVIGHLKLSRQTNTASFHFTGAGAQNGMYVDYLELDTNSLSYSDYRDGLVIDPNLTIYFAGCNVDPIKLEAAYTNRLVWVPSFAGPNSTVSVPYTNCAGVTQYCLMNANLADSPVIAFFGTLPNAFNQPFVLNDPTGNCTNVMACPSDNSMFKDFTVRSSVGSNVFVELSIKGDGTITPNLKQSQMAIGKKYVLTATPSSGWVFAGWSGNGLPEGVDTSDRVLKFTLENNLMLTANFTPKLFTLVKGSYHGLFLDATSNRISSANSGGFTFTLGADGTFSGRLMMGATNYAFSSKFSASGAAQVVAKHGHDSANVDLQLDMTGQTGQVEGFVNSPQIQLLGDLAPVWTMKDPSPFAGRFTMVLTNGGTNRVPGGDSYGSLTVNKLGVVSVGGKLADGSAFSQSVPISKDGYWPFYTYVAKGGDFLLGWIAFQSSEINGPTIGETNLFWSKAASSKARYYPSGFTNTFNLASSPYANSGKDSTGLALTDPVVILRGGDLVAPVTNAVAYKGKLMYSTNGLTLSINPASGGFTGRFQDAGSGPSILMNGVILQNQDSAFGFFLGPDDESSAVLLQSK